jgi:multiple sugar transport system substrate-binding protein
VSKPALKGMTWNHPRGYDPMVACSRLFKEQTGIEVHWDKRSLQDFEAYPVEELARNYDLIVIDHPHVGQITHENCLLPLDIDGREDQRKALQAGSVGASYASYHWQGRQWGFPIDAATQVQAYRPDALSQPLRRWHDVVDLARNGRVLLPLRPPHSLMTFYTLCANQGSACNVDGPDLADPAIGAQSIDLMREIAALIDPACFNMDPITVFEWMAEPGSPFICAPLIYGYVSYATAGFRKRLIKFADIPAAGNRGPVGSALGGTGIAVSAFSVHREEAVDFAYWVAGAEIQRSLYATSGGQAGHAGAWEDDQVNAATSDFYRDTRVTLESAWVRPRHDGYMRFQQEGSERLNDGLKAGHASAAIMADLNMLFAKTF